MPTINVNQVEQAAKSAHTERKRALVARRASAGWWSRLTAAAPRDDPGLKVDVKGATRQQAAQRMLRFCILRALLGSVAARRHTVSPHNLYKLPPLKDAEARRLNLLACPRRATPHTIREFGIDTSLLPESAEIYVCQDRRPPHSGILYVKDMYLEEERARLMQTWPSERVLFGPHCDSDKGELTSYVNHQVSLGNNDTALVQLEQRINAFTGLHVGKFAHKTYSNQRGAYSIFNNLHNDVNGACCGLEKMSLARVMTVLLYTRNVGVAGGHTVFPILQEDGDGRAAEITEPMWRRLQDPYYKATPYADHFPDQHGNYMNHTLAGVMGEKCATLAHDDARGVRSSAFGIRPAAGDAVIFWMKNPDKPRAGDPFAFHGGCPLISGTKACIQKFFQEGGDTSIPSVARKAGGDYTGASNSTSFASCHKRR